MFVWCYLPLSTGTYSIVIRVYVLVLVMYLDYKVPVISILVVMNVMGRGEDRQSQTGPLLVSLSSFYG
jgi:hypothetical protein